MENNKFLYVIFTICVVILVLLIVQMCILIPMAMHSGHGHMHSYPMMSAAPAQAPAPAQFQQVQTGFPGPAPFFAPGPMHKCGPGFGGPGFHHHFHGKPMMPPKHLGDKPMPGQPGLKPGPKAPAEPQQNK